MDLDALDGKPVSALELNWDDPEDPMSDERFYGILRVNKINGKVVDYSLTLDPGKYPELMPDGYRIIDETTVEPWT